MPNACLLIGAVMLDISAGIEQIPEPGQDVEIQSQAMSLGGCAYNVADIMQHFHARYDLCAPIGRGYYAEIIRGLLAESGKTTLISTEQGDNGYCLCLIDQQGERTFLTLPGVECQFESEWLSPIEPEKYDSVYVCGYELEGRGGEPIVRYLEKHPQWNVFYAPGPCICSIPEELHKRMFQLHPVLHLNEKESLSYTGCDEYLTAAKQLNERTGNAVIVTLGKNGTYLCENKDGWVIPSLPREAVDTTGAGDSHIGTIIAALSRGETLKEAVKLANKMAGIVVSVSGPVLSKEQFREGITCKGRKENE